MSGTQMMNKVIKVAGYCRVSTEEQKKHGYSIATQVAQLKDYIDDHDNMMLVDFYVDEGISAVKVKKRLALQRLLDDVKDGKIDMILFTRLDRWGRDMKIYYQIQDILDKANVSWKAISEDYETETATGKFKVNIMMSVAQQERDKGSERIKDVFNHKVKNGEAIYGSNAMPLGFMIDEKDGKKIVAHNPQDEQIVHDLLKYYKTYHSIRKAIQRVMDDYGIYLHYESVSRLLKNTLLYGSYKENENYCEPYITKAEFDEIQSILERNIRTPFTSNIYIFSKLIKCPLCGQHLVGCSSTYRNNKGEVKTYFSYRCENYYTRKKCTFKKSKSENYIEAQLLDNLGKYMDEYIIECEVNDTVPTAKNKKDADRIRKEMGRVNNLYIKGRLKEEDYEAKYTKLEEELKKATPDTTLLKASDKVKELNGINIRGLYETFNRSEKQTFWIGLLKDIYIDADYNVKRVDFF